MEKEREKEENRRNCLACTGEQETKQERSKERLEKIKRPRSGFGFVHPGRGVQCWKNILIWSLIPVPRTTAFPLSSRPGFGVLTKQGSTFMDQGEMFSVKYDDMLKFS